MHMFVAEKHDRMNNKDLSSIKIFHMGIIFCGGSGIKNTSSNRKRNNVKFPTYK